MCRDSFFYEDYWLINPFVLFSCIISSISWFFVGVFVRIFWLKFMFYWILSSEIVSLRWYLLENFWGKLFNLCFISTPMFTRNCSDDRPVLSILSNGDLFKKNIWGNICTVILVVGLLLDTVNCAKKWNYFFIFVTLYVKFF